VQIAYRKILNKATGKKYSTKEFFNIGKRIVHLEMEFNEKAGMGKQHEKLPRRLLGRLTSTKNVEDGEKIIKEMLEKYHKLREKEKF